MTQQNSQGTAQTPAAADQNAQQQYPLTPLADTAPVVVNIESELSGVQWVNRFPGSSSTDDLVSPFKEDVVRFIVALKSAGASVVINATRRPPERAYLMRRCWEIANDNLMANNVPPYTGGGVDIEWAHKDSNGNFSQALSKNAARAMVNAYGMQDLTIAPSLASRHVEGNAIDMNIAWSGVLAIANASGQSVQIASSPREGTNAELATVGETYNVIKFNVPGRVDKPHWSTDGR